MTAKDAGRSAVELGAATLEKLKGYWLVVTFAIGALFWAEDHWAAFVALPDHLRTQEERVDAVEARLERVEAHAGQADVPAFAFKPRGKGARNASPGGWASVRLVRVGGPSMGCGPAAVVARMTDASGRVFESPTSVREASGLDAASEIAFAVRVHPMMRPGPARLSLRISRYCGARSQVAMVPDMTFRVLDR